MGKEHAVRLGLVCGALAGFACDANTPASTGSVRDTQGHEPQSVETSAGLGGSVGLSGESSTGETGAAPESLGTRSSSNGNTNDPTTSESPRTQDPSKAYPDDPLPPSIRQRPDPQTATEQEACVYYFRTQWNRREYECYGREPVEEPNPEWMLDCPDVLFSSGSQLTVAGVIECADVWAQASCEKLDKFEWPTCGLPRGALAPGEACRFATQCNTGYCLTELSHPDNPECGVCFTPLQEGEPCEYYGSCDEGLECRGLCTRYPEFGIAEGLPCERYGSCAFPNFCITFSEDVAPICRLRPVAGEPCPIAGFCANEAFCNEQHLCQDDVELGWPCTSDEMCVEGTFCDAGTCLPLRGLGLPCNAEENWAQGNCEVGASCVCDVEVCSLDLATCLEVRRVGETCGGATQRCDTGSRCQDGRCVAIGLQGLAAQCPPQ